MDSFPANDRVLLHCKLNYRASAFSYLYQVTLNSSDEPAAKEKMLSVWQPNQTWQTFINKVLKQANKNGK